MNYEDFDSLEVGETLRRKDTQQTYILKGIGFSRPGVRYLWLESANPSSEMTVERWIDVAHKLGRIQTIEVGDRVRSLRWDREGVCLGSHDTQAWVRWTNVNQPEMPFQEICSLFDIEVIDQEVRVGDKVRIKGDLMEPRIHGEVIEILPTGQVRVGWGKGSALHFASTLEVVR